ncbi:MAG: SRPBCC domain-containing protein [Acidimicrobiia bacterium]
MSVPSEPLECTFAIRAQPETVWTFWTDPVRLCEWWGLEAEAVPEPGGRFRVVMDQEDAVMSGEYLELDPPRRLVFTFGWEHPPPSGPLLPGSTRVEVELIPDGDGTRLVLRHFGLPATATAEHRAGWNHFVGDRLVAVFEASGQV